jgi:hypothetical protein
MSADIYTLLGLPLELRELIYEEVLLQPLQTPNLLRSCRQIYTESRKYLFERPLVFQNQLALSRWLQQVPQNFLHHVRNLLLELEDVDLTPLLDPVASSSIAQYNPGPPLHTWDLYETETVSVIQLLRKFKNIKVFTLRAIPGKQSYLYRDFLEKILQNVSSIYPGLQSLNLQGAFRYQSLFFLRSFKALSVLSLDGISASGAVETASILSTLELKSIHLTSQSIIVTSTRRPRSESIPKPQSFGAHNFHTLDHFLSPSIAGRQSDDSLPAPSPTTKILASLNIPTLSNLSIILPYTPDRETLEALEEFLEKSNNVERLELDWPGLDSNILERYALLPNTLKCLWIRARDMGSAFDILWTILVSKEAGGSLDLRNAVLVRDVCIAVTETGPRDEEDDAEPECAGGEDRPIYTVSNSPFQVSYELSVIPFEYGKSPRVLQLLILFPMCHASHS